MDKREKLSDELAENLHETLVAFVQLNKTSCKVSEMFLILRNGIFIFTANKVAALAASLDNKSDIPKFIKECQSIGDEYMQAILEELEERE